jgi:hypothetical protein
MNAMKRLGTALVTAAILTGCSTGSIGVKPDVGSQAFEAGKTTRTEVVNTIGLPQRMEQDAAGNDHYFYERSAHLTGMCLACGVVGNTSGVIPGAAVQNSKEKARKNAVEFVFNADGTLMSAQ